MTDPTTSPTPPWASTGPLDRLRRRLRRRWVLHRRWLAAGALALAVLVALRAVSPAPPPQADAVVAVRDLTGGQQLGADDLAVRQVPRDLLPEGAVADTAPLVGRTLASPTRAGELVTDRRVLDEGLLAAYPGTVAVPARLADAASRAPAARRGHRRPGGRLTPGPRRIGRGRLGARPRPALGRQPYARPQDLARPVRWSWSR